MSDDEFMDHRAELIASLGMVGRARRWWAWYAGPAILAFVIMASAVVAWFVITDWLT